VADRLDRSGARENDVATQVWAPASAKAAGNRRGNGTPPNDANSVGWTWVRCRRGTWRIGVLKSIETPTRGPHL
jgi:hypothetical protein